MTENKRIFFAVLLTSFLGPFSGSALNLAIPAIGGEFLAGAADLSRVISAYLFGSVMLMLPMGRLADIAGRKKIYVCGVGLFILATLASGLAVSLNMLYVTRFLQGCVLTMIFSTGMAIIISVHKPSERGKVIGYSAAATYTGLSAGPVLGGFLCDTWGWRSIFFATAAVMSVSLFLAARVKKEWYGTRAAKLDTKGALCYMAASPLLLYGISNLSGDLISWCAAGLGLFGIVSFILWEKTTPSPILDLHLFSESRIFAFSNLAAMIHYSATFAISFLMSLYLQLIALLPAPQAGAILLLQPLMMAVLSPKAGALSDRISPRKVASIGMAIDCAGLFCLSLLNGEESLWYVGAALLFIGVGFALFSSPNNNAIMGAVEPKFYGTAASVLAVMRLFGQAASMAVVTLIMGLFAVDTEFGISTDRLLGALHATFLVFAVLCALGVVASLARDQKKGR